MIEKLTQIAMCAPKGEGKTTLLTDHILGYCKQYPDRFFYCNYYVYDGSGTKDLDHLHPQFRPLERFEQIRELRKCLVVVDELGSKYIPSHEWASPQNNLFAEIASNIRKWDVSFAWSDQNVMRVDHRIRNNVDYGAWIKPFHNKEKNVITCYYYEGDDDYTNDKPIVEKWIFSNRAGTDGIAVRRDGMMMGGSYGDWEPSGKSGLELVSELSSELDLRMIQSIPYTTTLSGARLKLAQESFDTRQIIPKVSQFQFKEQVGLVSEYLEKNNLKPNNLSLDHYQVTTGSTLTEKQRNAILVELRKMNGWKDE